MILIYSSARSEAALRADAHDAFRAAHDGLIDELAASEELLDTHELSLHGAKVVRTGDEPSVTDGPHMGATEWVGGYYLVDVADEGRALEIAARFVEARYASVEVRRVR
ncbi:YciI family protein [Agrococcus sp. Marseille-P2731]|uniref:YciI family protein n=1 Tax=Agrococcus sp. Marseille-P2731 TaxID=1841862 RepID=UPI0013566AF6|nr:YciI family protein [Agrococcus sp. Marseille-P2731]